MNEIEDLYNQHLNSEISIYELVARLSIWIENKHQHPRKSFDLTTAQALIIMLSISVRF